MQAQIDAARNEAASVAKPKVGRALSDRQMAEYHYESELKLDEQLRNRSLHDANHRETFGAGYVQALRQIASGAASDEECRAILGWAMNVFAANGNLKADFGSPEWRRRARDLAAVQLEIERRKDERDQGEPDGKPRHPLLKAPEAPPALAARIMGPDSTKSLSEILPTFIRERGASPATNYEAEVTVRMLHEALGEARPLYQITRQDIQMFKRTLSETPANYTKRFPDMLLPDAIRANKLRKEPYPVMNPVTVNDKYLSRLHSILNWCVRNDLIPDNPATGVKIDGVKQTEPPRVNFSPGDLALIFDPQRFDTSKPFDEPQWAKLISLFSGMRASELAQMKLDSIRTERGVLVFVVEESTKTISSQRLVPVHSTLLALGLDKRIADLRGRRETHLFPIWYRQATQSKARARKGGNGIAVANNHFPRFIPKRFNDTESQRLGITDRRKSWHSFRHTFKTGLARAGVMRSMQDLLCGHSDSSAGARYIHDASVEALKEAIEKLQFDGFNLSARLIANKANECTE
jgi:integrase